jgi:hypothetical protein
LTGASPFRLHLSPRPKSLVFLDSSAQMASGGATPQPTTSQRHTTAPSSGTLSSTTPLRRARGRSSVASWTWSRASCASSITLFCCSTGRPGPSTAVVVCLRCCIHTLIAPLVSHRSLSTGISLPITLIDSSFDLLGAVISSIRGYRVDEMPMLGCLFIVVMSVLPLLRQGSLVLRLVWLWGGPRGWVPIGLSRRRSTHSERRSAREDESFLLRERLVVSPLSSACSRRQLIADDDPLTPDSSDSSCRFLASCLSSTLVPTGCHRSSMPRRRSTSHSPSYLSEPVRTPTSFSEPCAISSIRP